MKKVIIAGNWKMNHGIKDSLDFVAALKKEDLDPEVIKVIAAPFTNLYALAQALEGTDIKLAAQNMFFEDQGAYTGEVSPLMLKELGVEYVILGHSERRTIFKEDDPLIQKKVRSALNHGLKVIFCCGESLIERESKRAYEKIEEQVKKALVDFSQEDFEKLIIAYEPIWAIGTGKTASSSDAQKMCAYIRNLVEELYGAKIAERLLIQYGGSVKRENINELLSEKDIDGALVGGASLKAEDYKGLVNYNYEK